MRINLKKTAIGTAIASAVVAGGIGLGSLTAQAAPTDTEPSAVSVEQAEAEIQADLKAETTISQEQAEQASLAANPGAKLAGETALASWDEETGPAVVWEVLVTDANGQEVAVIVNAADGSVIESEAQACPGEGETESVDAAEASNAPPPRRGRAPRADPLTDLTPAGGPGHGPRASGPGIVTHGSRPAPHRHRGAGRDPLRLRTAEISRPIVARH